MKSSGLVSASAASTKRAREGSVLRKSAYITDPIAAPMKRRVVVYDKLSACRFKPDKLSACRFKPDKLRACPTPSAARGTRGRKSRGVMLGQRQRRMSGYQIAVRTRGAAPRGARKASAGAMTANDTAPPIRRPASTGSETL